jgi:hypothetical protein
MLFLAAGRSAHARPEEGVGGAPPEPPAPTKAELQAVIDRGVAFLVDTQNENGSWGTPAPNLFLDIYSPVPSAHQAYEVASSALALSALIEVGGEDPDVQAAIRRARDWLVENHDVRRARADVLYNTWAHAYALEAFARLLAVEEDEARRAAVMGAAREVVALLERYEYVDGGWGYYDFNIGTQTPSHGYATSFTTASVLVALHMASEQGVEVPDRIVRRAKALIRASGFPNGAYCYSFSHRYYPQGGINKIKGSLARTPACVDALLAWGEALPEGRVVQALDNLETYGHFLLIARKYPRPHEAWYANSGYFCFYGYYYASRLLERAPPERRAFHAGRIAAHIAPLQEEDGAWWDYQLFGYHKYYGSGYVLMTLGRALAAMSDESGDE